MNNPFELLDKRLENIEALLLEIKQQYKPVETPEQEDVFLSVNDTAEFLKLSRATIYSKVSKNELPVMKRGKQLYFSKKELLKYIQDGHKSFGK